MGAKITMETFSLGGILVRPTDRNAGPLLRRYDRKPMRNEDRRRLICDRDMQRDIGSYE